MRDVRWIRILPQHDSSCYTKPGAFFHPKRVQLAPVFPTFSHTIPHYPTAYAKLDWKLIFVDQDLFIQVSVNSLSFLNHFTAYGFQFEPMDVLAK